MLAIAADWTSAIGSLAAVAVALYIAIRSQRRTRVAFEFDPHGGDLTSWKFRENGVEVCEVWLRIRLRNRGRSLAEAAQVFPTVVRSNGVDDTRSSKWLKVSGLQMSRAPIPPGADRYFDVGFIWMGPSGQPSMALLRVGEFPGEWDEEKRLAQSYEVLDADVVHEVFVLGTCSNSAPKYGCLRFRLNTDMGVETSAINTEFERLSRRKYLQMTSGRER